MYGLLLASMLISSPQQIPVGPNAGLPPSTPSAYINQNPQVIFVMPQQQPNFYYYSYFYYSNPVYFNPYYRPYNPYYNPYYRGGYGNYGNYNNRYNYPYYRR
jgi:hypothetical protein